MDAADIRGRHAYTLLLHHISARYAGSAAPRPVILTGSHNLSESALKRNDELLLKVSDSQPLYDAFYDHFNAAYNTGTAF